MRILVTGATGFLGSRFVERALRSGHDISVLTRSPSDLRRVEHLRSKVTVFPIVDGRLDALPADKPFDAIVHLATAYGRLGETPTEMVDANVGFPARLLQYAAETGVRIFVNADTSLPGWYNIYAATKKGCLDILKYYSADRGIRVVNLGLEYIYGPGDDLNKFVPLLIESIVSEEPIPATSGEQKRDFLYVDDAAGACLRAVESADGLAERYASYAIGTGVATSFREFGDAVSRIAGKKQLIGWGKLPNRKNELFTVVAATETASRELGWTSSTPLTEGIRSTVEWHVKARSGNADTVPA